MSQLTFQYQAIDGSGVRKKGTIRASDREDAYRRISASGERPLRIAAQRGGRGSGRRATLRDISQITHQFAVLSQARIPIVDSIRSIAEQETKQRIRDALEDIARRIEGGSTVTDAMGAHREMFGDVYIETIHAAEVSGNMIEVLQRLGEMLDRQHTMSKNVRGALMYPACVSIALSLAIVFLLIYVVPRFTAMFSDRGLELPLPTQMVVGVSDFMRYQWYVVVGVLATAVLGLRAAWKRPELRLQLDTAIHRVPVLRHVVRGLALSRFANVLGLCLRSGINLIDALQMAGRASARPTLIREASKMCKHVDQGGRLTDIVGTCHYLTPFARRMIIAGEEAGELPRMCEIVAKKYDEDVEHLTRNVSTIIEPLLIVGLAIMVGVIALAVFLPMWDMASEVG